MVLTVVIVLVIAGNALASKRGENGRKVVIFGDSIVYGARVEENEQWTQVFSKYAGVETVNEGVNGTCLMEIRHNGNLNADIRQAFCNLVEEYNFSGISDCLIAYGTNDYGFSGEIGSPSDKEITTFFGALNASLDYLAANWPELRVVLLLPGYAETDLAFNNAFYTIQDYRQAIALVAYQRDIPVIDCMEADIWQESSRELFQDRLHPNAEGHHIIGELVASAFLALPDKSEYHLELPVFTSGAEPVELDEAFTAVRRGELEYSFDEVVRNGLNVEVSGWVLDTKGGSDGQQVYLEVRGSDGRTNYFKAHTLAREDLAEVYGPEQLKDSGFFCRIPVKYLRAARNTIRIIRVAPDGGILSPEYDGIYNLQFQERLTIDPDQVKTGGVDYEISTLTNSADQLTLSGWALIPGGDYAQQRTFVEFERPDHSKVNYLAGVNLNSSLQYPDGGAAQYCGFTLTVDMKDMGFMPIAMRLIVEEDGAYSASEIIVLSRRWYQFPGELKNILFYNELVEYGIDVIEYIPSEGAWKLEGWALCPGVSCDGQVVYLIITDQNGNSFNFQSNAKERESVARAFEQPDALWSGFECVVSEKYLNSDLIYLQIIVADAETRCYTAAMDCKLVRNADGGFSLLRQTM